MVTAEKLVERISGAGSAGIKKTDLRREFGDQLEPMLEDCLTKGLVYADKRGGAYYCWHQKFYIQSLLNSDPKFRLTYDMIKSLEENLTSSSRDISQNLETLARNISNLAGLIVSKNDTSHPDAVSGVTREVMPVSQFKEKFDSILASSASSIGWVELKKIRNEMCDRYDISSQGFYKLVGALTSQYQDKYELSTGGGEGVIVRGLLHGFVRCI